MGSLSLRLAAFLVGVVAGIFVDPLIGVKATPCGLTREVGAEGEIELGCSFETVTVLLTCACWVGLLMT